MRGEVRLAVRGEDGGEPLVAGDVLLIHGSESYRLTDRAGSTPIVRILPGQRCVNVAGQPVHESMSHGLRTWGNEPDGPDVFVIGAYVSVGELGQFLTNALPQWLIVRKRSADNSIMNLMAAQIINDHPGQGALPDRLLDVLLIDTVRAHTGQAGSDEPSWLGARDPVVRDALAHLYADTARK